MGIDWEGIFGDENSENFEDHFSGTDISLGSYGPGERPATKKDAISYLENHRLADADKSVLNFMARVAGYSSFTPYILACLKNAKTGGFNAFPDMWKDDSGAEHPAYSHLFHANSVVTSVDYIRQKCIYSRQYGEIHRQGIQTGQWSDQTDKLLGIYNDIFFDNSDISFKTGYSVYGPVVFVFDIDILSGKKVRVTKNNPGMADNPGQLRYKDLFYTSSEEFGEAFNKDFYMCFLSDFSHHVTAFDTGRLDFGANLKALYIEKCFDGSGRENDLKTLLCTELAKAGFSNVPVVIRPGAAVPESKRVSPSTSLEEQWRFPAD